MMFKDQVFTIVCLIFMALVSEGAKNVLVLIADDAGFESGIYGNKLIKTPNLDDLGKQSCIFDEAFTSVSSCSPSRSSILTGLPSHQNGMYGLHHQIHHFNSFDGIWSLPKILSKNGIKTGIIGKKHVGPESVYPFDFSHTEENNSILQVGRNITFMRNLARTFLHERQEDQSPFLLYVGFHDPHRCGHTYPEYGNFCEKFGINGTIPDWKPQTYDPSEVLVPYFIQDTPEARKDIVAQYAAISRLDQGIGLILTELKSSGFWNNTLIIYSSDNGIPFPNGRTNVYDSGIREPFLISTPHTRQSRKRRHRRNSFLTSLLDITPTVLSWFNISYPSYNLFGRKVFLTGQSLLPITEGSRPLKKGFLFGSHNLHEVTMYYPMRYARTKRFKLIHNLNYGAPFPIDQDFYLAPTFQDILNRTLGHQPLPWFKSLKTYYNRPEWELYDLKADANERKNVVKKKSYQRTLRKLRKKLFKWQNITSDPWLCSPHSVYEAKKWHPETKTHCFPLYNGKEDY